MELYELLNKIKQNFQVDETLRAYLFDNKIELIDYTEEIDLPDGHKLDPFFGKLGTLYLQNNKISCIENNSINLITPANYEIFSFLASLIGTEITDYDSYAKLLDITQQDLYQEI